MSNHDNYNLDKENSFIYPEIIRRNKTYTLRRIKSTRTKKSSKKTTTNEFKTSYFSERLKDNQTNKDEFIKSILKKNSYRGKKIEYIRNNNINSLNNSKLVKLNSLVENGKENSQEVINLSSQPTKKIDNDKNTDNKNTDNKNTQNKFRALIKNKLKLVEDYSQWEGDNYFPFKAHMIEGPCSFRPSLVTGVIFTIPVFLFLIFNSNYLSIIITLMIIILYIIIMILLLLVSFNDPGIIRRFKSKDNILISRKETYIFQLGYIRKYKFCSTCSIIRPTRSTHCSDCNNCVEKFDHHCPWIGNCTGKRNYKFFFIFLALINILSFILIIISFIYIYKKVSEIVTNNKKLPKNQQKQNIISYALSEVTIFLYIIIYSIISLLFIVGLLFYHIKLIHNNITTKEDLKSYWEIPFGNPFSRNRLLNWKNSLFPLIQKYSILSILRKEVKDFLYSSKEEENPIRTIKTKEKKIRKKKRKLTGANINNKKNENGNDKNGKDRNVNKSNGGDMSFVNLIKNKPNINYKIDKKDMKLQFNEKKENINDIDTNSFDISNSLNIIKK